MKINFLLPGIRIGGGTRVVFEYANRLSDRGHDVTILYPLTPPQMAKKWLSPRARITQLLGAIRRSVRGSEVDWFNLDVPIRQIPTLSPDIAKYFEDLIPDADITIATAWPTAYTVKALNDPKGEKAYFIQHYEIWETWNSDDAWKQVRSFANEPSSYPVEMYEVTPSKSKVKRQKDLVDSTYKLPLSKITISSWLADLLNMKFDQNVVDVITNSVNHSTFYPEPNKDSEEISLLLPLRNKAWKGKQEAKKLIEEIGSSYEVEIHMYGPKPKRNEFPENAILHTNISDDELRHLYSNTDIFVFPSWVEGFGLPPLEAMACRCAVVTTNVGAVSDYAIDGETASLVPPRDSSALIKAVRDLIEDDHKRVRLQNQAHRHAKKYTWNKSTISFESALKEIIR